MYDLAISFATENRMIAKEIALALRSNEYKIFYDEFEMHMLWGEDLSIQLPCRYNNATYCLILLSKYYLNKMWTNIELKIIISKYIRDICSDNIILINLDGSSINLFGVSNISKCFNFYSTYDMSCLIEYIKDILNKNKIKS